MSQQLPPTATLLQELSPAGEPPAIADVCVVTQRLLDGSSETVVDGLPVREWLDREDVSEVRYQAGKVCEAHPELDWLAVFSELLHDYYHQRAACGGSCPEDDDAC